MRNEIVFADTCLSDYGVYPTNAGVYTYPTKKYDRVSVPGRNGDLFFEQDAYENVVVRYPAVIAEDFADNINALISFLASSSGYQRIENTFEPEIYRVGCYLEQSNPKYPKDAKIGTFELQFNCKPQKYLKSGEIPIELSTGTTAIYNPTNYKAKPLMRVVGTGTINVGGSTITVTRNSTYIDIDCELLEAYTGSTNQNANVSIPDDFGLSAGDNNVIITGITSVTLYPRWWTV